jgi:hypothetical protein
VKSPLRNLLNQNLFSMARRRSANAVIILPNINVPNSMNMEFNWLTFNGKSGPANTPRQLLPNLIVEEQGVMNSICLASIGTL